MSQHRIHEQTIAEEPFEHSAFYAWDIGPVPTWEPFNFNDEENVETHFQTGLPLSNPSYFDDQQLQQISISQHDFIDIDQSTLSDIWSHHSTSNVDTKTRSPSTRGESNLSSPEGSNSARTSAPANAMGGSWEGSATAGHLLSQGPFAPSVRQTTSDHTYSTVRRAPGPSTASNRVEPAFHTTPTQRYSTLLPSITGCTPSSIALPSSASCYGNMGQYPQNPEPAVPPSTLMQLGASHDYLVNNRPAPWIKVLDVDHSYHRSRTPSPIRLPVLCIFVRVPEHEAHHRAVYLREYTVSELIWRVVKKYGFSAEEKTKVTRAVRVMNNMVAELNDESVRMLEHEMAMTVKVTSMDDQDNEWQLEIRY